MIYFLVDEPNPPPYKGVRGKAKIKIHNDIDTVVRICETNMKKYLGSLDHPMAKELINLAKKANRSLLRYLHCISLHGMIIK
jgi:hypothetical protein